MLNYIHDTVKIEEDSIVGNFSSVGEDCKIGARVIIHNNVTIYPGTVIGDDTEIFDGAVIGRPPKSSGNTVHKLADQFEPTEIGKHCVIGANSVIYAQCRIGSSVLIGDGAKIREGAVIDDGALIAMNCTLNHDVTVGSRTKITDLTHMTPNTVIGEDVFIGVGVITVNDNAMRLAGTGVQEVGKNARIVIRKGSRIGSGAILMPNIKIGENAFVGARTQITQDVSGGEMVVHEKHDKRIKLRLRNAGASESFCT